MDLASRPSPVSKRSESRSNLRDLERDSLRKLGDNRWRSTIIFMASLRAERKLHGLWPWKEESRRNKGPHQGSFVSGFFFLVFSDAPLAQRPFVTCPQAAIDNPSKGKENRLGLSGQRTGNGLWSESRANVKKKVSERSEGKSM